MKKYLCLALVAFFGAAIVSPMMAVVEQTADKKAEGHEGKAHEGKEHGKHEGKGKHGKAHEGKEHAEHDKGHKA